MHPWAWHTPADRCTCVSDRRWREHYGDSDDVLWGFTICTFTAWWAGRDTQNSVFEVVSGATATGPKRRDDFGMDFTVCRKGSSMWVFRRWGLNGHAMTAAWYDVRTCRLAPSTRDTRRNRRAVQIDVVDSAHRSPCHQPVVQARLRRSITRLSSGLHDSRIWHHQPRPETPHTAALPARPVKSIPKSSSSLWSRSCCSRRLPQKRCSVCPLRPPWP